ncbi:MAG: DUF5675 family protein [Helicobacteraceae bacterium]|nr:DUF5675 family protein [Helicobacteraceae bacterium]
MALGTVSEATINRFDFNADILEEKGRSTTENGMNRIPTGVYNLTWHYKSSSKHDGRLKLCSQNVPAARGILIRSILGQR